MESIFPSYNQEVKARVMSESVRSGLHALGSVSTSSLLLHLASTVANGLFPTVCSSGNKIPTAISFSKYLSQSSA
uniref:Uncharacterized protein n=1 Tax=Utricularia reniformis TaxID=192314 RepID=A0A1Y0B1I0_9LAMI|nr:hypothetical protein AEK19_MT1016 [Utricularia reniformis]ART31238.1 hypothetical protein AEK19_MT1016 [Utricularia reniformis]